MTDDEFMRDHIAMMDQVFKAFGDMARLLFAYKRDLLEAGFTADEAMALTIEFQRLQWGAGAES